MITWTLTRILSFAGATLGKLETNTGLTVFTLEPEFSYPSGVFKLTKQRPSEKYNYDHFKVTSVALYTGLFFHIGNSLLQTTGCTLVGTGASMSWSTMSLTLSNSRMAMLSLTDHAPNVIRLCIKTSDVYHV